MRLYDTRKQADVVAMYQNLAELTAKGKVVQISTTNPRRSLRQNAYLHLLLSWFGLRFGYSVEDVKRYIYKHIVNADLFEYTRSNVWTGEAEVMQRSASDLDAQQMALSITRFRDWSASVAGLYLPEANEYDALLEMRAEVSKADEFIQMQ